MRRIGFMLAIALVAAGCSSGSSSTAPPQPSNHLATDTARAKGAVLQLRDLPAGYTVITARGHAPSSSVGKKLLSCLGLADARGRAGRVQARGAVFVQRLNSSHAREVESAVVIEPTASDLDRPFRVLTQGRAAPCFETYLRSVFASSPQLSKLQSHGLAVRRIPVETLGDQRATFEAHVVFSSAEQSIDTTFDFNYVRRGRSAAELVAVGLGTVFPAAQENSLLKIMVDRLKNAN
jgi:hypothetical protein